MLRDIDNMPAAIRRDERERIAKQLAAQEYLCVSDTDKGILVAPCHNGKLNCLKCWREFLEPPS